MIFHFYQKELISRKLKNLFLFHMIKNEYVIHIRNLQQALNDGLVLKKVHRIIKFNQKAWLKSCIEMNTELRKKAKDDFKKDFFKLMNNSVFRKTMENLQKHRGIKHITTEKRKKLLSIRTKLL